MHRSITATACVVFSSMVFAPAATAQLQITLTGRVEALAKGGCDAEATHRVACTEVLLKSETVDLGAHEGRTVEMSGIPRFRPDCLSIDVTTAEIATARTSQLALFGFRPGRPVSITTFAPIGSAVVFFWSCEPGFLPLGPFGTYLLDPFNSLFDPIIGISIGVSLRTELIPNEPSLVGATIHYQTVFVALVGGFDLGVLNPNCFTIRE